MLLVLPIAVFEGEEKPQLGLGMWAWSQSTFTADAARKDMLDFCIREGIRHIDQHVSIRKQQESYRIQNAEALSEFIIDAAKRNISVNTLRGERDMFFEANHNSAIKQLAAIIEFDRQLPEKARLAGIKYDVEPYLTMQWKAGGQQRRKVICDYLVFLEKANELLDKQAPHLELSVDVPFWWDKPEFAILFNGSDKLFIHHIQDLTDWIAIMSYRRDSTDVLRLVKTELMYAEQHRLGSVSPGVNTIEIKGKEHWISFWGTHPKTFRKTLAELRQELSGNPAVRFIMLHHYESLVEYLGKTPDKPDAGDCKWPRLIPNVHKMVACLSGYPNALGIKRVRLLFPRTAILTAEGPKGIVKELL
jgi:hypothetical protein